MSGPVLLGLRANAPQFGLLLGINALVGAMVGIERTVLPLVGAEDFDLESNGAILAFVVAFGATKSVMNLVGGALAERVGRRRLLVLGWLCMLPVPLLIGLAPTWRWVVVANLFLGAGQGLAWSMTVVMKIDLIGPRRRGLALGLNEAAGYLGVAGAAFLTGLLAQTVAPREVIWVGGAVVAVAGLTCTLVFVRDTAAHVAVEDARHGNAADPQPLRAAIAAATFRDPVLRSCSQAGLVNNLNDALVWGLAPLFLAANGTGSREIAAVAAIYPAVWGVGQLGAGWLSDRVGRSSLIVGGMLVQGAALALLVTAGGMFAPSLAAAAVLGLGTALVYPSLLAAVSDVVRPRDRAQALGVYRFWRDTGFVAGGLAAGVLADLVGIEAAILAVAVLTCASGVAVARTRWREPVSLPLAFPD